MYVQRVTAESIAVSGTGSTAVTTITVPSTFEPVAGAPYDILISAQVPVATDGTILAVSNGTDTWNLFQGMTGNYVRSRQENPTSVSGLTVQHSVSVFNLVGVRG